MNVNEVLANRASEILGGERGEKRLVHPNDDVNKGQSSNDTFPTAMHVAAVIALERDAEARGEEAARHARPQGAGSSRRSSRSAARTCRTRRRSRWARNSPATSRSSTMGCGTWTPRCRICASSRWAARRWAPGLNAHPQFAVRVAAELARLTGLPFVTAPNKFEALGSCDGVVHAHGALKTLAASLMKIANDVRWLASGPALRHRRAHHSRRTSRAARSCRARSIPRSRSR